MNEVILHQFLAERNANSCCLLSVLAVYQDFLSLGRAGCIRQASVLRQQNRKFVYFYRVFHWTAFSQRIPCSYILHWALRPLTEDAQLLIITYCECINYTYSYFVFTSTEIHGNIISKLFPPPKNTWAMRNFRLPSQSRWELCSCGLSRSKQW